MSTASVVPSHSSTDVLISDQGVRLFQWICFVILEVISVFGTGTNVINIICFVKQGLRDPVNVSLLGLAVSDCGSLVTLIWTSICGIPGFQDLDLPFDAVGTQYLISGWPHIIFTRITSWITALIAVERCMCITMPLKVKNIFTRRRVTIIIVCVFIILTISVSPVYFVNHLAWISSPADNKTLLGLVYSSNKVEVETVSFLINNALFPFSAFILIIVCTAILVYELRKQSKWRKKSASSIKADDTLRLDRDQKVARMVIMISAIFISCFVPSGVFFIAMAFVPELSIGGQHQNVLFVCAALIFVLEAINSSTNIFIYYHMGSKYKAIFRKLFKWEQ